MIRVAIFNTYLNTMGGGERLSLGIASALAAIGCEVDVLTFEDEPPSLEAIRAGFGDDYTGFRVVSLGAHRNQGRTDDEILRDHLTGYPVFINNTAASSFPNPCPLGIYVVMFPFQRRSGFVETYHHFLCISEYTEFYTQRIWGPRAHTTMIYPAADVPAPASVNTAKEKNIVCVGRFNVHGHTKNQGVLVDAFESLSEEIPKDWTLTLIGRINTSPETEAYVETLKARAKSLPLRLLFNASEARKQEVLERSAIYWHGTGIGGSEPADAARMEHFGISVVEAMGAGAIPLCYSHGGVTEIVQHAQSGFLFNDLNELVAYTGWLVNDAQLRSKMTARAVERAQAFNRDVFNANVQSFFREVCAS